MQLLSKEDMKLIKLLSAYENRIKRHKYKKLYSKVLEELIIQIREHRKTSSFQSQS